MAANTVARSGGSGAPHAASATTAVLLPVLARPNRVKPLLRSLEASSGVATADPVFLLSPSDVEQRRAVSASGARNLTMPFEPGPGDYAKKMNLGARWAVARGYEFVFLGADDLHFHPGWLDRALDTHAETGACVIGTNDLGNPRVIRGTASTHSLVHRDYLECGTIDETNKILHEGYHHLYVDNELVETAQYRGTFVSARDSAVEHLHPRWRKGEKDATYVKGQSEGVADERLFKQRRRLWS